MDAPPGSDVYKLKERLDREKNEQWLANKRRQEEDGRRAKRQAEQDARIDQLETKDNADTFRSPTSQEVADLEREWNTAHPFTSSAEMPKFADRQIRVPGMSTAELERKLAAQELAIKKLQQKSQQGRGPSALDPADADPYSENSVMTPGVRALIERMNATNSAPTGAPQIQKQLEPVAPSIPNPRGVIMRTLSNGRVSAIIGGKSYQFANQQEANAFLEAHMKSTPTLPLRGISSP